ncbi:hypothetical protein [Fusobacterium sp. SYSU M8D902]|uniref:hypothetical protein n=1 Tax=Fusobacterium sp. SYSU M8D902 TaxID=3159562 RepID=UPI0032E42F0B
MKLLIGLLTLSITFSSYGMLLHPIGYDKVLDEDGTAYSEFYLKNTSKDMQRYKIEIKSTGKENDISKHMSVYPNLLKVDGLTEETFKVYVEDDGTIHNGENNFILSIRSVSVPSVEDVKDKTKQNMTFQVGMNVEMSAYKGKFDKPLTIVNSNFENINQKKYWKSEISNSTGRGIELGIGFLDKANTLIDVRTKGRLFNGSSTIIKEEIPKGAKYIVFYDYNNYKIFGDQKIKIK